MFREWHTTSSTKWLYWGLLWAADEYTRGALAYSSCLLLHKGSTDNFKAVGTILFGPHQLCWISVISCSFLGGFRVTCDSSHRYAWIDKTKGNTHSGIYTHTHASMLATLLLITAHTTKTMCTPLYKQAVKSRSRLNPRSMLFLRGEWGVRWIRHEGSSPSSHPCPCSGRTETN